MSAALPREDSLQGEAATDAATVDLPVIQFVLLAILFVWFYRVPDGASRFVIMVCVGIFASIMASRVLLGRRVYPRINTYLTVEILLFIFCYLIYFHPYVQFLLGLNDLGFETRFRQSYFEESNRSIILSTIGVLAINIGLTLGGIKGAVAAKLRRKPQAALVEESGPDAQRLFDCMRSIVVPLLLLSVAYYRRSGLRSAGEGRYTGNVNGGAVADGLSAVIVVLAMVALAMIIAARTLKLRPGVLSWVAAGVAGYWCVHLALVGDRNGALLIAMVPLVGYATFIRRLGPLVLVASVVGGLLIYNSVEVLRSSGEASVGAIWDQIVRPAPTVGPARDNSFSITTATVRAGLATTPSVEPYGLGFFKLVGILGIFPFARGLLFAGHDGPLSTSEPLVSALLGNNASWGVGTNMVTDAYMDFGVVGGAALLMLVGALAARFCRSFGANRRLSVSSIVLFLVATASIAELPRYDVTFPVRMIVWAVLIVGLSRYLARPSRSHGSSASSALEREGERQPL